MAFRSSCEILNSQLSQHLAFQLCSASAVLRLFFLDQLIHYQYRCALDLDGPNLALVSDTMRRELGNSPGTLREPCLFLPDGIVVYSIAWFSGADHAACCCNIIRLGLTGWVRGMVTTST